MTAARPKVRAFDESLARVREELGRLAASGDRLVAGPWFGEVGFEVLYWVPFLRWAVREFGLDPGRLLAVSRGGTGAWYGGVAAEYADVFDGISVADFRHHNEDRWRRARTQKQMEFDAFDAMTLDALELDWDRTRVLHPSLMYDLFRHFWRGVEPVSRVLEHMELVQWAAPADPVLADLPDDYVAARFYFRPSFPDTPENRGVVHALLEGLARDTDVVLLNTQLELDDHLELDPEARHRVLRPLAGVDPARNLHVQSAVVSRARAFAGTYGGLSYVALAYGVPSIALASSHRDYALTHVDVARRTALRTGATLSILDRPALALAATLGAELGPAGPGPDALPPRRTERASFRARLGKRLRRSSASVADVPIKHALRDLRALERPRVVGAWEGTLEDELLVWLPFLRRLRDEGALDPGRDVILGRSGAGLLYAGLCAEYRAPGRGAGEPDVVPALAVRLYAAYLAGEGESKTAVRHGTAERLAARSAGPADAQYVAACFEPSPAAAERGDVARLAHRLVPALAERTRVVLVGEHAGELGLPVDGDRIADAAAGAGRDGALAASCAAIAGARGLVGTWGGTSLLAPHVGVPALVVAPADPAWLPRVDLASRVARQLDASLAVVEGAALELVARSAAGLA